MFRTRGLVFNKIAVTSTGTVQYTSSLIRRTACARAQFSGCSSTTNAHSETGQMAVCCQNLTLGALSSRSPLSLLVGALFKNFGHFLNTLCMSTCTVHPGTRFSTYQTASTVAKPYSDIAECTIHVDIHHTSTVFVTTVFLNMDFRVRNMVM